MFDPISAFCSLFYLQICEHKTVCLLLSFFQVLSTYLYITQLGGHHESNEVNSSRRQLCWWYRCVHFSSLYIWCSNHLHACGHWLNNDEDDQQATKTRPCHNSMRRHAFFEKLCARHNLFNETAKPFLCGSPVKSNPSYQPSRSSLRSIRQRTCSPQQ